MSIGLLFEPRRGHVGLAHVKLLVEVGEFLPRVLEEELADENERSSKHVDGQDSDVPKDRCRVRAPKNEFVGDEEFQLAHEPKAKRKQHGDGDEQDVGNHWKSPRNLVLSFPWFSIVAGSGQAAGQQRRPSSSTPGWSKTTADGEGCGAGREADHRWKGEVACGGWADVARCRTATSSLRVWA